MPRKQRPQQLDALCVGQVLGSVSQHLLPTIALDLRPVRSVTGVVWGIKRAGRFGRMRFPTRQDAVSHVLTLPSNVRTQFTVSRLPMVQDGAY